MNTCGCAGREAEGDEEEARGTGNAPADGSDPQRDAGSAQKGGRGEAQVISAFIAVQLLLPHLKEPAFSDLGGGGGGFFELIFVILVMICLWRYHFHPLTIFFFYPQNYQSVCCNQK